MRKQRDIFSGIVLYLCITTILSFLLRLNSIIVDQLEVSPYLGLITPVILYALTSYILCYKWTELPRLSLWFVVVLVIFDYAQGPILNLFKSQILYFDENYMRALNIKSILSSLFYLVILPVIAYYSFRKNKDYTMYGVLICVVMNYLGSVISTIIIPFSFWLPMEYLASICSNLVYICMSIYLLYYFVSKRPKLLKYIVVLIFLYIVFAGIVLLFQTYLYEPISRTTELLQYITSLGMLNALIFPLSFSFYMIACIEYFRTEQKIRNKDFTPLKRGSRTKVCILAFLLCLVLSAGSEFLKKEIQVFMPNEQKVRME